MRASEIARLLPELYQDAIEPGTPIATILAVMEALHAPDEAAITHVHDYLDPRRAPDAFVEMQARWLALGQYVDTDAGGQRRTTITPGPLRDLVAFAGEAARQRGTAATVIGFLTCATGVTGFTIEENPPGADGQRQPFHIRVKVPKAAVPQIDLVHQIVANERPAFVTFELQAEE